MNEPCGDLMVRRVPADFSRECPFTFSYQGIENTINLEIVGDCPEERDAVAQLLLDKVTAPGVEVFSEPQTPVSPDKDSLSSAEEEEETNTNLENTLMQLDRQTGNEDVLPPFHNEPFMSDSIHPLFDRNFIPKIPKLFDSVNFVRALQDATLDNGDLSQEILHRIRNPPQNPLQLDNDDDLYSLKQFLATGNAAQHVYFKIRDNHNERYPEEPMLSFEQVRKRMGEWSGMIPIVHDMCPNSCMGYTGPFSSLDKCKFCLSSRYDPITFANSDGKVKNPLQQFYTIPLAPYIQNIFRDPEMAQEMAYRQDETKRIFEELEHNDNEIKDYTDLFCGSEYLEAVSRGDITEDDIIVMSALDGAQFYRNKESSCWIYIWIILDLRPSLRYKKRFVLPGGFIPGPNNPENTDSFLFPGFHHLAAIQKEGLSVWNASTNRLNLRNLFYYLTTADGPGSVHVTGLVGHQGAYLCRLFCNLRGRRKPDGKRYYPVLLKPTNLTVEGSDHPDIKVSDIGYHSAMDYERKLSYLLKSRNMTDYESTRRVASGISVPSILSGLPPTRRLSISAMFAGDAMHVPTLNLGEYLVPIWRGMFDHDARDNPQTWPWAVLTGSVWKRHGEQVAAARPHIPSSFDCAPRNIALKIKSGYKAKEWQSYFYGLAPGLLYGVLPKAYWINFCRLVHAVRILLQRSISKEELKEAQVCLEAFGLEFEQLYVQRRIDRIHFIRPCMHALLHMGLEVPRLGPPSMYGTWHMERTIGNLGEEIRQHSNPFANLSERGVFRAQVNSLTAMIPCLREVEQLPRGSIPLGDGYILLRAKERTCQSYTGSIAKSFLEFAATLDPTFIYDHTNPRCAFARWARLQLPTGQTARCAWKENQKKLEDVRMSRCVKIQFEGSIRFAEVEFYAALEVKETTYAIAYIHLFSTPEEEVLRESCYTLYVTTKMQCPDASHIISVKNILSVISMQPLPAQTPASQPQKYFVWEKIGLDVSLLAGCEESIADED